MIICPLSLHSAYTSSLYQVAIDRKDKHLKDLYSRAFWDDCPSKFCQIKGEHSLVQFVS